MKNKWVILIIVFLILIGVIGFLFGRYNPDDSVVQKLVNEQLIVEKQKHFDFIKEKDIQISDLQGKLETSKSEYTNLSKQVSYLKKELSNVKPPETTAELRKRFLALGYPSF